MAKTLAELHFEKIRGHALRHKKRAEKAFNETHRHANALFRKHKVVLGKIRHHTIRSAALAGVSVGILAAPAIATSGPQIAFASPLNHISLARLVVQDRQDQLGIQKIPSTDQYGPSAKLASLAGLVPAKIKEIAPEYQDNLTDAQAAQFSQVIQEVYNVKVTNQLDGVRLYRNQGIIAGEQHLPLYPGQPLSEHVSDPTRNLTGMVPGLPAYGYFANNRQSVTQLDISREEYYMALQTFLTPGWSQDYEHLYSWFKYREMFIINPETGDAVKVDIGDSGPGLSTHRQFGGSNEVIMGLGLGAVRTGHVYVFFVDPSDKTPLGPLGQR